MEKNSQLIQKFTNAIQKGLDYVNSHSAWEIAKTIQPQFKDTPVEKIAAIIDRYKSQDTWKEDTIFEKDSFELLENILEESGELKNGCHMKIWCVLIFQSMQQKSKQTECFAIICNKC